MLLLTSHAVHFRAIYFEAVDTISSCIKQQFDQPEYKQYSKLETLLLKGAVCESREVNEELQHVRMMYTGDVDVDKLIV